MKTWPVQDAKARFSQLLETCLREGPQLVTRRGLGGRRSVPATQWHRLADASKRNPQGPAVDEYRASGIAGPDARQTAPALAPSSFLLRGLTVYLLDTNIVSELRKLRPHGAVVAWLRSRNDRDIYISAVTLGEIQAGIEITREQDTAKAAEIEQWVDQVSDIWNVLSMATRHSACGPSSCTGAPTP